MVEGTREAFRCQEEETFELRPLQTEGQWLVPGHAVSFRAASQDPWPDLHSHVSLLPSPVLVLLDSDMVSPLSSHLWDTVIPST